MTRFRFVVDHRDTFEVKRMCDVIEINHKRVARVMAKNGIAGIRLPF